MSGEVDQYTPIINFVIACGGYAYRNSVGGRGRYRFGKKGQCDISGILPGGRRLEIEVKEPGKEPSYYQIIFMEIMRLKGALVLLVTSVEEVQAEFVRLGLCRVA